MVRLDFCRAGPGRSLRGLSVPRIRALTPRGVRIDSPGSNAGSLLEAYGPGEVASLLMETPERLLTPGEVAEMFRVDPKTVTRWAAAGRIGSIRTPGGHRRFRESEVNQLLVALTEDPSRFTA